MAAAVVVVLLLQQVMIVGHVRLEVNPISHPSPVVAVSKWMEHPLIVFSLPREAHRCCNAF